MFPALDSATPPSWTLYEGRQVNTDVTAELLDSDLPWVVDAEDSDAVRQNAAASVEDEQEPEARVPMTLDTSLPETTTRRKVVTFRDASGHSTVAIPASVMRQFSQPTEDVQEDRDLDLQTMLTKKGLLHIAQVLWGFRLPCHPSYSPEVVLESFIFFYHHKMWALAGRTESWLRWYFIEHKHCPNDLLLTRAWLMSKPSHPVRALLISSLYRRLAEISDNDSREARVAFKTKFHVMYAHRDAAWFVDLRPGSWFADFHAFIGKATDNQALLDEYLDELVDSQDKKIKPSGFAFYIEGVRRELLCISTEGVTVSPCVLGAPQNTKSDFQTHIDALCSHVFQSEDYQNKILVEPELIAAQTFEGTAWELEKGPKTGLIGWKDILEPPSGISGAITGADGAEKVHSTPTSDGSGKRKRAADDAVPSNAEEGGNQCSPAKKARPDSEATIANAANEREVGDLGRRRSESEAIDPSAAPADAPTTPPVQSASSAGQKGPTQSREVQENQQAGISNAASHNTPTAKVGSTTKPPSSAQGLKPRPGLAPKKKVQRKSKAERDSFRQEQQARDEQRAKDLADQDQAEAIKARASASRYDVPAASFDHNRSRNGGNRQNKPSSTYGRNNYVASTTGQAMDRVERAESANSAREPEVATSAPRSPSVSSPPSTVKQPRGETNKSTPATSISATSSEGHESHTANTAPRNAATTATESSNSVSAVPATRAPTQDTTDTNNAQPTSNHPATWTTIQEVGAAGNRPGLLEFTLRSRNSKSTVTKTCYMDYAILQAQSALYADKPLTAVVQPVDLSTNDVVSPRVFEQVCKMLLDEGEDAIAAMTSSNQKVDFCVVAAALGCRDLVERCLGSKEEWEKGHHAPQDQVVVKAYRGIIGVKSEAGRSSLSPEQLEKQGGKMLLDWVAIKLAVKARRDKVSQQVPEMFEHLELEAHARRRLIADVRREVNNLKVKYLARYPANLAAV